MTTLLLVKVLAGVACIAVGLWLLARVGRDCGSDSPHDRYRSGGDEE